MQGRLTTTDLACRRGDRVLFRELSLSLGGGAALHITGANGVGKSSLLRLLAGLLRPYAGSVATDGAIALMDERPALDLNMPLGRALSFWSRIDGTQDDGEIAAQLALGDLLDVPVRYLSTGQRKRATMARVIGQRAQIWLLDEPLSGLDEASQGLVIGLVGEHTASGGIAVIASHQPFALEGLQTLAIEQFVPPLPDGEGIEGWGNGGAVPRDIAASNTPIQPPPQGGGDL
ncbi:MAG: heme ABC exporter ATP-binding protein CcmA [Erythrobacter sp.]|nr:heme ABC exporter ATP-binding protein CcmA [Erythrobacter sp.]